MAAKVSTEMRLALSLFAKGKRITDAARKAGVSPRGLRYALERIKKPKKSLDVRK